MHGYHVKARFRWTQNNSLRVQLHLQNIYGLFVWVCIWMCVCLRSSYIEHTVRNIIQADLHESSIKAWRRHGNNHASYPGQNTKPVCCLNNWIVVFGCFSFFLLSFSSSSSMVCLFEVLRMYFCTYFVMYLLCWRTSAMASFGIKKKRKREKTPVHF